MKTILPMLAAVLDNMPHESVVEFGAGLFSTPFLYKKCTLLSIEEDKRWRDRVASELTRNARFKIKHNVVPGLSGCNAYTLYDVLDKVQKTKFRKHFNKMAKNYHDIDVLVVDNFNVTRVYALLAFYPLSKVSIYRVSPKAGANGYELLKKENLKSYRHFSNQSYLYHTNMLVHNSVDFNADAFSISLQEYQENMKVPKAEFKFIEL